MSALPFSLSQCPWVAHPSVVAAGPSMAVALLRRRLERYLHAVTCLELAVVHEVARSVALESHLEVEARVRMGALKLLTDEAHHALESSRRLYALTGRATAEVQPAFLRRLARLETGEAWLARWLFATVTETCLSNTLRLLASDTALAPELRAFAAQHAADEEWHGTFFGNLLVAQWSRLGERRRARAAELLPLVAAAYLDPDLEGVAADLVAEGFGAREVSTICGETRWETDAAALAPTRVWLARARQTEASTSLLDGVLRARPFCEGR